MRGIPKALFIPYNSKGELFLQDREGHKPPPWGFFGGGIDEGETPIQAVIREAKEELDLDLGVEDLIHLGDIAACFSGKDVARTFFYTKLNRSRSLFLKEEVDHGLVKKLRGTS